jgi:ELP3 family radical SAM enzyme/protein acetyltransferase
MSAYAAYATSATSTISGRQHIDITLNTDTTKVEDEFVVTLYNKFISKISTKIINDYSELNPIFSSTISKVMGEYKRNSKSKHVMPFTKTPSKSDIAAIYERLVSNKTLPSNFIFDTVLTTNVVRSSSGVLPISVALDGRQFSCSYNCSYCPNECVSAGAPQDMARSYLSSEGTFIRGLIGDFNIATQVIRRLAELEVMGHLPDKCEFIALGGTFDCFPKEYQRLFSLSIFYACNIYNYISLRFDGSHKHLLQNWLSDKPFLNNAPLSDELLDSLNSIRSIPSIEGKNEDVVYEMIRREQDINTKSKCARIIGLVLETRPDRINRFSLIDMRKLGSTRIQLGIQHTDNYVLDYNNRGHRVDSSIKANKCIRDGGFKIDGHIMPDLPGTTLELDYEMVREVFEGDQLQLDYCKIYPCLDLPYTDIRKWKKEGNWRAIAEHNFPGFLDLMCYTLSIVPPWTRINRVQRDFPESSIKNNGLGYISDNIKTNLQQIVTDELIKRGLTCIDIRSREIRNAIVESRLDNAKLYIRKYRANEGTEFFISVEIPNVDTEGFTDNAVLLGLCRLRIPDYEFTAKERTPHHYLPVYRKKSGRISRIRELHVYGNIASNCKSGNSQHRGVGKFLISVAEAISQMYCCDLVTIISGVGVRDYYDHLGYTLDSNEDQFMIKYLGDVDVKPMVLFGKEYDYSKIQTCMYNSIISLNYINPLFKTERTVNKDTCIEYTTSVNIKMYENIQGGVSQGFSFSVTKVPKQDYYIEILINIIIFVVTYVLLHVIFFILM